MRTTFAVAWTWLFFAIATVSQADDAATRAAKLAVGQPLPAFSAPADSGSAWESAQHVGKKVVVFYFYPGDFTGGCTRQAQAYRDALARIEGLGAEVVGVSGDLVATHKLFKEAHGLTHSLLADSEGNIANLMGVPVKAGGKLRATGPDRKPLLTSDGQRIDIQRPVTLARWTIVVARDGTVASLRSAVNPLTDAEEAEKIVATLSK